MKWDFFLLFLQVGIFIHIAEKNIVWKHINSYRYSDCVNPRFFTVA